MPENVVDILEDELSPEILAQLLRDRTTARNILWCTHDYAQRGKGYQYADEIRPECITGEHGNIIRPRVLKSKAEQTDRVKDMAEVFTPAWVVKNMVLRRHASSISLPPDTSSVSIPRCGSGRATSGKWTPCHTPRKAGWRS